MKLEQRFREYVVAERLWNAGERLLLAVSGGVDSVVLCDLCAGLGIDFVVAHCNFQLRGAESERDESFVRGLGERYGKEVLVHRFDTGVYMEDHPVSVQVAARELRYVWFRRLLDEGVGTVIVTAHHLDDNIETLLMNLFKGSGVAGMRGMLPRLPDVVRPLLFARKEDLVAYAAERGLVFVEDSSNGTDKYSRNYLRHQVVPLLESIYPQVVQNLSGHLNRFREIEQVYNESITSRMQQLIEQKGDEYHIPVLKLKKALPLATMVYELIHPFGFTPAQVPEVVRLLDSASGHYMTSATHRILKNRHWMVIAPLRSDSVQHVVLSDVDTEVCFTEGVIVVSRLVVQGESFGPVADAAVASLDADRVTFPMILRLWKTGDYFYPLGMLKKKKVARFLIDRKLSLAQKERVWVLEANKRIVWVVGQRIDDRFKVVPHTRRVLQLSFSSRVLPF